MAKYGIQKTVGPYKHITGKSYDMYYKPDLILGCQQTFPKGKWLLDKKTRKGAYRLGRFKTRTQCVRAMKKELRI